MTNPFAADGTVSPARAAAPAQDARQRVDPVTAVALPAANRIGRVCTEAARDVRHRQHLRVRVDRLDRRLLRFRKCWSLAQSL